MPSRQTVRRANRSRRRETEPILQFLVVLAETDPPVRRRIQVPGSIPSGTCMSRSRILSVGSTTTFTSFEFGIPCVDESSTLAYQMTRRLAPIDRLDLSGRRSVRRYGVYCAD